MPQPAAPGYSIRIRRNAWTALRQSTDLTSDTQLAELLNLSRQTAYQVLTGLVDPSPKFIAAALCAFPFASFDKLFEPYRKQGKATS